jgi:hypothetical protein
MSNFDVLFNYMSIRKIERLIIVLLVLFSVNYCFAQTVFNVGTTPIKFNNNKQSFKPNINSGNTSNGRNVGDVCVYTNVVTVGGQGIDCIVKTVSISSGSAIDIYDDNSSGGSGTPDSMFGPRATFPSGGGSVKFEFSFITNGSYSNTTKTGTLVKLTNAVVNIFDIDISTSASSKQFNKIDRVFNYILGKNSHLTVSYDTANNMTQFLNSAGQSTSFADDETRALINYDTLQTYNFIVGQTGSGPAYYYIDFSLGPQWQSTPVDGGTIATSQNICYNGNPAAFTSTKAASGFTNMVYRWQYSTDGGTKYADIASTNSATYDAPTGQTKTIKYRRKAFSSGSASDTAYSNVVTITVPTTYNWAGSNSNSYKLATNWVEGCVPHYKSNIAFTLLPSNKCALDSSVNLTNVTVGGTSTNHVFDMNGYTLHLFGTLSTSGRNLDVRNTTSKISFSGTNAQSLPDNSLISNIVANLQINNSAGVTLADTTDLTQKLTLTSGVLTTNNKLTFKSNSTYTAIIESVSYSNPINGNVIVEKYVPARRAFRLISPTVTTNSSIKANWQEGGTSWNNDPKPGFGTHITGPSAYKNGVDSTITQNYSLFTYNNATSSWQAVENTLTNTLIAGTPYRLMVRGSRSVNIYQPDNFPTPTNTTLRTTGTLKTGSHNVAVLNSTSGSDNFIGNPYQCDIDASAVLNSSTDINKNYIYMWDPFINSRGAYSTVDLSNNTATPSGTVASKYVRPGQGFFVKTATGSNLNPQLTFTESHKNSDNTTTATSRMMELPINTLNSINVVLVNVDSSVIADGCKIKYDRTFSNDITDLDAGKPSNLDEEISIKMNTRNLAIECRNFPISQESIQLNINKYRASNYLLRITKTGHEPMNAVLVDHYLNNNTKITSGQELEYAYEVMKNEPNSNKSDRFEIVISDETIVLNSNEMFANSHNFASKNIEISPNPSIQNSTISIQNWPVAQGVIQMKIYNSMAQLIESRSVMIQDSSIQFNHFLASGVYQIWLDDGEHQKSLTLIVK